MPSATSGPSSMPALVPRPLTERLFGLRDHPSDVRSESTRSMLLHGDEAIVPDHKFGVCEEVISARVSFVCMWQDLHMRQGARLLRLAFCAVACALLLAACAETPGYANSPAARRCDRTGDIDERHACER